MLMRIPGMLFDPLGPLSIRWSYLPKLAPWLHQLLKASSPKRVEEISVALTTLLDLAVDAYTPLLEDSDATDQVTRSGLLYVYGSDAAFDADGFGRELRRRRSVKFEVLDSRAIGELEPFLAGRCAQGIYCPDSAFTADPYRLVRTLADQFIRKGGEFVHAEVLGVEVVDDRISNLLTTGGLYPLDRLVLAAGAWSHLLGQQLGANVPLDTERGYVMVLPNAASRPTIPFLAVDHHVAVTPTTGGLRLAGTAEFAGLRAPPNLKRADALLQGASPFLGPVNAIGAMRWMSFRPSMPDSLPVIGWAPGQAGAFFAFGHCHLGLSLAAITGRLVAEAMAGREFSVDVVPFRADRWTVR